MRRLCLLLPDVDRAHRLVDDLRNAGIDDADIFVIASEHAELGDLPDAGGIANSDFYPQLERGLALGGAIGVIGGLVAMRVLGAVIGGGALVLFGLVGAGVNALLGAIAGSSFPNSRLTEFQAAIEAGHVLVMVDVPRANIDEIERLLSERHPEIEVEKLEPRTPILPHA
jgi:hypothetical protein